MLQSSTGEVEVLLRIIQLDMTKIRQYIRDLQKAEKIFRETIPSLESRLVEALRDPPLRPIQPFLDWFRQILSIQDLPPEPDPAILLGYIRWAQRAKDEYFEFLKAAFSNSDQVLPRWISIIFKLGRYGIAARALVQTASELPALFNPIFVQPIAAPPKARFEILKEDMPLTCVLRRVQEINIEDAIPRLARIWDTNDVEGFFRRSCSVDLVAHAELQILNFYDHNPEQMPRLRFIGVSKKSCYLCSVFLATHPEAFYVSSCHQKLYLSWIPPPAVNVTVYKLYRTITKDMTKRMEAIAKKDLSSRLGLRRLPVPADSTAGVSLSGLMESTTLKTTESVEHDKIDINLELNRRSGLAHSESHVKAIDSEFIPHPVSHTLQIAGSQRVSASEIDMSHAEQQFPKQESLASVFSMVFHFKYLGDERRQDIIKIDSFLDPYTQSPSWSKLVELLNPDDSFGLIFRDSDVLIFNGHIRVRNERQLLACLQYLQNSGTLNSEVVICDGEATLTTWISSGRTER